MSANPITTADPVAAYLSRVSSKLKGISESQKEEIVAEIRSHLVERVQQFSAEGSPSPAEAAVAAMGDADTLASQFLQEERRRQASRSFSPWVLLRAAAGVSFTGVKGLVAFLAGMIGYGVALGLVVVAILKPFMPSRVGFWIGPHLLAWGMPGSTAGAHEVAGPYFAPVSVVLAFLFGSGTTLLLRWLMRLSPKSIWDRSG